MGVREDRCRTLISEARLRHREGHAAKAVALFGQAAALAEELGVGQIERQHPEGFQWLLDSMVFWREAGKPAQVVRVYRRIRQQLKPGTLAVKADVLILKALHDLRSSLAFVDLSGMRLGRLNFQGADMTGMILRGSDLRGTNMQGAQLKGANLEGARLQDVNLQGANLAKTYWKGSQLHRVNMQRVILEGAFMLDAQLEGIDFSGALLERTILNRSNMRKTILVNANLEGAKLEGTKLTMADLRRANFAHATLEDADLSGVLVEGTIFEGANLMRVNLDGIHDARAVFSGAKFTGGTVRLAGRSTSDRRREVRPSEAEADRSDDDRSRRQVPSRLSGMKDFPDAPPETLDRDGKSIGRKLLDRFRK